MQTASVDQLVGHLFGRQEQYRVERLLSQGRLTVIYRARDLSSRHSVALTLFQLPQHFSAEMQQRFHRRFSKEGASLLQLRHAGISPVFAYGEQAGYAYLVTPYLTNGSLADLLKREGPGGHEQVIKLLEPIFAGLAYAHRQGVVHGTLKPANIVFAAQQQLTISGFGLMHMLQISGITSTHHPYAHLMSVADTLLAAPEYIAPEVVEGRQIDRRSDIYALGALLFEVLSGSPPFSGNDPLEVAQMHVQRPLPSLRTLRPEVPLALASVINQALDKDPERRFQRVEELHEALVQSSLGASGVQWQAMGSGIRPQPLSTKLEEDEEVITDSWQLMPPIVTGKVPVPPTTDKRIRVDATKLDEIRMAAQPIAPFPARSRPPAAPPVQQNDPHALPTASMPALPPPLPLRSDPEPLPLRSDPGPDNRSSWWSQTSEEVPLALQLIRTDTPPQQAAMPGQIEMPQLVAMPQQVEMPQRVARPKRVTIPRQSAPRRRQQGGVSRRTVIAVLASGGVLAAGGLLAVKANALHIPSLQTTQQGQGTQMAPMGQTKSAPHPTKGKKGGATHTGTVVGMKTLAVNSAQSFVDPADGKGSLLIHLPNGNFAAFKRQCTHEGVTVNYDPNTHTLVCPAHNAIFDPQHGGAVLQGPAMQPLPKVVVHVNSDGTITTAV